MHDPDLLSVLDALYRLELDANAWLRGIVESARPSLDAGRGIFGLTYQAAQGTAAISNLVDTTDSFGASKILAAVGCALNDVKCAVTQSTEADVFVVNGIEPNGSGLCVASLLHRAEWPSPRLVTAWTPIAEHFARASALRRRFDGPITTAEVLTEREREVLSMAAAGKITKVIGFDLGIADATVRVLLLRAAKKLGARSRSDAIARFAQVSR